MNLDSAPATTGSPRRKPLRFQIGIGLLVLYPLLYLIIPIAPFLPLDAGSKVAVVGGVLAGAEAILLLAIALVGKETYQAIKARLRVRRSTPARSSSEITDA